MCIPALCSKTTSLSRKVKPRKGQNGPDRGSRGTKENNTDLKANNPNDC